MRMIWALLKFFRKLLRIGVPALERFCCEQKPKRDQYNEVISNFLGPDSLLLDAGGGQATRVRVKCKMIVGIDYAIGHSGFDAAVIGGLEDIPFAENTFDMITASWVVEHLEHPEECFREFNRVLKPKGVLIIYTPNVWHYFIPVTELAPVFLHRFYLRTVLGEDVPDFRTYYRANSPKKLVKKIEGAGLKNVDIRLLDFAPMNLQWFTPAYALGMVYHRLVNRFDCLSLFRANILVSFVKTDKS